MPTLRTVDIVLSSLRIQGRNIDWLIALLSSVRPRVLLVTHRRRSRVGARSQTREAVPWNGCLSAERLRGCLGATGA